MSRCFRFTASLLAGVLVVATMWSGETLALSRPNARQAPLTITNVTTSFEVGSKVYLTSSGGSGVGAISFSSRGAGCSISGSELVASRATSCVVTARKAASSGYSAVTSSPKSFNFFVAVRAFDNSNCTIVGTERADSLVGTSGNDVICGLGGNDRIDGAGGNDIIDGGMGNDRISGGLGVDRIAGGVGTDTISGDAGADVLSGGSGADTTSGGTQSDVCEQDGSDPSVDCESLTTTPVFEGKVLSGTASRTDGNPVVGARIEVSGNSSVSASSITDEFGGYQVVLPAGTGYRLTMTWNPGSDQPFPSFIEGGYRNIRIDGDTIVDIEIPMPRQFTVHVDDDRGDAIEGATVRAYPGTGGGVPSGPGTPILLDWFRYHTNRSTLTDELGSGTLWLYDGWSALDIEVYFTTPDGATSRQWLQPTISGDSTTNVVLRTSVSTISGRITRHDGTPIEGVKIELSSGETLSTATVYTDADGYYRAVVSRGGDYRLWMTWYVPSNEEYPWRVDAAKHHIDASENVVLDVVIPRPNRVKVTVTDQLGQPLEGAVVRTTIGSTEGGYSDLPEGVEWMCGFSGQRRVTAADGAAYLWIFPISQSPYALAEYTLPDGTLIRKQIELDVFDGSETTVALPTATSVLSGTMKRSDGKAISGATIEISSGDTGASARVTTDSNGVYRATVPAGGDYRIWMTWYPGSSDPFPYRVEAYRHPVEVRRDTVVSFTIPLPRTVTVTVTNRGGAALSGAIVRTGIGSIRGIDPPAGAGFTGLMYASGQSSRTGSDGKGFLYLYDFPYLIDALVEYTTRGGSFVRVAFDVMVSGNTSTTVQLNDVG